MRAFVILALAGAAVGLRGPGAAVAAQPHAPSVEELQQRLQTLEREQAELRAALEALQTSDPSAPAPTATPPVPANRAAGPSAFNPAVSVILNGRAAAFSQSPDDYRISGMPLGGEAGPGAEGLSLDETELVLSGNIDDRYFARVTLGLHSEEGDTEVELEEGFVDAYALPGGSSARIGRFFSEFGYLNSQHPHQWDFVDAPLNYRALLGEGYFDDGIQLRWLAPTSRFLEVGIEAFRGDQYPAGGAEGSAPGVYTAFIHTGGDVGRRHSWGLGFSWLEAQAHERGGHDHGHDEHEGESFTFSGDTRLWAVDAVWKWRPSAARPQGLTLQAEYVHRREDGRIAGHEDESGDYRGTQRGFYVQGVYAFQPRWRVGLRYDRLWADNRGDAELLEESGLDDEGHNPHRYSVMLDYARSEFSRWRLQYNHDRSSPTTDHQWFLQYVMSLGAHGAHRF